MPPQAIVGGAGGSFVQAFNNADNPCFHHQSEVRMADGTYLQVQHLRKGHRVAPVHLHLPPAGGSHPGPSHAMLRAPVVQCVVRTDCVGGRTSMVWLQGGKLGITPWHPVLLTDGTWAFPADLAQPLDSPCAAVYR